VGSTRKTSIEIFTNRVTDGKPILYISDLETGGCRSGCSRVKAHADFEVIDIMGDMDPYPALLGIEWEFENHFIIDLKKELMNFDVEGVGVIQLLDPYQRLRFTEPTDDREEPGMLDQLYKLTTQRRQNYINPVTEGSMSW